LQRRSVSSLDQLAVRYLGASHARRTYRSRSRFYELAGDDGYTRAQFAAEISRQAGKPVVYTDLSEADYKAALLSAGLPDGLARMLADSDGGASKGGLFDAGRQLSALIGRATAPLANSIRAALKN